MLTQMIQIMFSKSFSIAFKQTVATKGCSKSMDMNPQSFLNRAEDYFQIAHLLGFNSSKMTTYFNSAEQAFKAILFHFGVNSQNGHLLSKTARANEPALQSVWTHIQPVLDDFEELYKWRNTSSYRHNDAPPISDPPITELNLQTAEKVAQTLIDIAKMLIR
jgi:hypothetical protein